MSSLFRALSMRPAEAETPDDGKPATRTIQKQQREIKRSLPFDQTEDFDNANKGFKDRLSPNKIMTKDGKTAIWDNDSYAFLNPKSTRPDGPDTANPSLWRQSKLCAIDGLFEVTAGIYQVRGLDVSNVSFIETDDGVIVIDPLTSMETGAAAKELYERHRGKKDVKAVIYTHSHIDHFGGVKGFVSQEDVNKGVPVLAPEGFLEHAISENVYVGTAMARRAGYMYGAALPRGPTGQIGCGLGQTVSVGTPTLIEPTDYITTTGETRTIDGVKMIFQMAPNTEAPAEMLIFFPKSGALCAAEDATHTFHNILTLRGAVVRDSTKWAHVLTDTIDMFGGRASVVFASHHWPIWGYQNVVDYLTLQRDTYAYVHDQTLRYINKGLVGAEIAEVIKLPPALETWSSRGYYGSVSHNVKAVYQRYLGWFDGNPAHLWEHIPTEKAKRYVNLVGGMANLVKAGEFAFNSGDFRWAAELLNHAVFAEPGNESAKNLLADTYEQLGYGAENGTWRDFYMSGAYELRKEKFGSPTKTASADILASLPPEMLMDSIGIQIDGIKASKEKLSMKIVLVDGPCYLWYLSNGAMIYRKVGTDTTADVTLTTTATKLTAIAPIVKCLDAEKLEAAGIDVAGDAKALKRLSDLIDAPDSNFSIVTP